MRSGLIVPLAIVLAVPAAPILAAKVEHTQVVPPKLALDAPAELAAIGQPTRLLERGGTLYVAGVAGIAALSADGRVLWATPLDPIGVREIAVDDAGIAYTGYQVTGQKTTAWSFFGDIPDKLTFAPSVVGMLAPDGKKVWQVNGPASRVSAPCLTPASIGVLTGPTFHIHARADGRLTVSTMDLEAAMLPNELTGRMFRPRPLFLKDRFVGGYFYNFYQIGPAGEEIEKDAMGRISLAAGPVLYDGKLLIGSYTLKPDGSVNESRAILIDPSGDEFEKEWDEEVADDRSATGDLVVEGKTIYASSNFTVSAFDDDGEKIWTSEGKDGALSAGSLRGVRFSKSFGYRYWGGNLMAVAGDRLYLATRREIAKKTWADVITVLDKKTGAYVKTIDLQKDMVDMLASGGRLVVATSAGLQFLALD